MYTYKQYKILDVYSTNIKSVFLTFLFGSKKVDFSLWNFRDFMVLTFFAH